MSEINTEKPPQFGEGHTINNGRENNFNEEKPSQISSTYCTDENLEKKLEVVPKKKSDCVNKQGIFENTEFSPANTSRHISIPENDNHPDIGGVTNIFKSVKSLDANRYATKKTIAQGMLDIALLTANASQLKYILQIGRAHEFYTLMLILISLSIGLQAVVGILYIVIGGFDINKHRDQWAANILNDIILICVFVITLINVVVSGFGMEFSNKPPELLAYKRHMEDQLESLSD